MLCILYNKKKIIVTNDFFDDFRPVFGHFFLKKKVSEKTKTNDTH
jgi:hypothetical protein